jgi:hypothetical protein
VAGWVLLIKTVLGGKKNPNGGRTAAHFGRGGCGFFLARG